MFVDGGHDVFAGAVKEKLFVVLMTISLLHVMFLNLQTLPQSQVLDAINLKEGMSTFLCISR